MSARKILLLLAFALPAISGTVAVPDAPAPECGDLESVANAPIRASILQRTRLFEGGVSLLATPSNMVEVAFGTSRDWNAARLTIRGADDPAEAVSVKFNTDPSEIPNRGGRRSGERPIWNLSGPFLPLALRGQTWDNGRNPQHH